jgi:hypothetical protein
MSISTITVAGRAITLVAFGSTGLCNAVEFKMNNAASVDSSPFTGQTQVQSFPGASAWSGTLTWPPLQQAALDCLVADLADCMGMANAIQIANPLKTFPAGTPLTVSGLAPQVDNASASLVAGQSTLTTKGWQPNALRLLLKGDYLQLGYRLHLVKDRVDADANGKATLRLWPPLREAPADGTPIVLASPMGLFRLASNSQGWSADITRLSRVSVQLVEYR